MEDRIKYNTDNMRTWANTTNESNENYGTDIQGLFNDIDTFVHAGFKGSIADEFFNSYEEKKKYFLENKQSLEDAIRYVNEKSDNIESNEQDLANQIRKNDYLNY